MTDIKKQIDRVKNLRCITYKYLPATNTLQSRIRLTDKRMRKSIVILYSYEFNSAQQNALAHLIREGWNVLGACDETQVIIMAEWDSDKQLK
tara:strand:+ start:189 stop:464 length:276 start_codon:yes stop_codon:yes gene_type:complete